MSDKTMTVKQIAEAIGKKERNIHNWLTKLSVKNAEIYAKIAEAKKTSKPAEYNFEETISIIEIGLGKNAATLYRQNAEQIESLQKTATRNDEIDKLIQIVGFLTNEFKTLKEQSKIKQLPETTTSIQQLLLYKDENSSKFKWHNKIYFIEKSSVYVERWALKLYRPEIKSKHTLKDKFLSYKLALNFLIENL